MNETWRFMLFMTLLIALCALLPVVNVPT